MCLQSHSVLPHTVGWSPAHHTLTVCSFRECLNINYIYQDLVRHWMEFELSVDCHYITFHHVFNIVERQQEHQILFIGASPRNAHRKGSIKYVHLNWYGCQKFISSSDDICGSKSERAINRKHSMTVKCIFKAYYSVCFRFVKSVFQDFTLTCAGVSVSFTGCPSNLNLICLSWSPLRDKHTKVSV